MRIEYKGQVVETKHHTEISEQEYQQLRYEYYKKPDFIEVQKEFINLRDGGTKNSNITEYYVKDLMAKTKIYFNKWSLEDVFNCKQLVEYFVSKTEENKVLFPDSESLISKIEKATRLGGKGVASKPSNFPIKTVDDVLEKYNVNNNWYDFSCGWGARLLGALKNNVNYYGTDPNYMLTERLTQMTKDYKRTIYQHSVVDIRTQGSEVFVPEWQDKIGLAFSSPPYFYLEDYKIGDQSWKEGTSYQQWKDNYLEPTIKNIYLYLVHNGFLLFNINNFKEYDLVGDVIKIATANGFKYLGNHTLENIQRINSNGDLNDNSEKIMVFVKKENETSELRKQPQVSIFDLIGDE